jgi:hypothetical protein
MMATMEEVLVLVGLMAEEHLMLELMDLILLIEL